MYLPLKTTIAYVLFLSTGATSGILKNLDGIVIGTREVKSLNGGRCACALDDNVGAQSIDLAAPGNLAGDADVLSRDGDRRSAGGFGNLEGLEANSSAGFHGFRRGLEFVVGVDSLDACPGGHRDLSGAGSGRCPADGPAQHVK